MQDVDQQRQEHQTRLTALYQSDDGVSNDPMTDEQSQAIATGVSSLPDLKPEKFSAQKSGWYWLKVSVFGLVMAVCVGLIILNSLSQANGVFAPMKSLFHLTNNAHPILWFSLASIAFVFFLAYIFPLFVKADNFKYEYDERKPQNLLKGIKARLDALRAGLPQKLTAEQLQGVLKLMAVLDAEYRAQRGVMEFATQTDPKWSKVLDKNTSPMWTKLLAQLEEGDFKTWLTEVSTKAKADNYMVLRRVQADSVYWVRHLAESDGQGGSRFANQPVDGRLPPLEGQRRALLLQLGLAQKAIAQAYLKEQGALGGSDGAVIKQEAERRLNDLVQAWKADIEAKHGQRFTNLSELLEEQLLAQASYAWARYNALALQSAEIVPLPDRGTMSDDDYKEAVRVSMETQEAIFAVLKAQYETAWHKTYPGRGKRAGKVFGESAGLINAWIANTATIAFYGPGAILVIYTNLGGQLSMTGAILWTFIALFGIAGGLASHGLTKNSLVGVGKSAGIARDEELQPDTKQSSLSVLPWWRALRKGDWTVGVGLFFAIFAGAGVAFFGYHAGFGLFAKASATAAVVSGSIVGVLTLLASSSLFIVFSIKLLRRMRTTYRQMKRSKTAWNRHPARTPRQMFWMGLIGLLVVATTAIQVWTFCWDLMDAIHLAMFAKIWAILIVVPAAVVFAGIFYDALVDGAKKVGLLPQAEWTLRVETADASSVSSSRSASPEPVVTGGVGAAEADAAAPASAPASASA